MKTAQAHPMTKIERYRQRHTIQPEPYSQGLDHHFDYRCAHDGIRVHPIRGGRWIHDPTEVRTAERIGIREVLT